MAATRNALLQETYKHRLRDCQEALLDNFTHMVKIAQLNYSDDLSGKAVAAREHYELDVRATNMVRAAESLLRMIAELKELLLFQDFAVHNGQQQARLAQLQTCKTATEEGLSRLAAEFGAHLYELETEFYAPRCVRPPNGSGPTSGDQASQ